MKETTTVFNLRSKTMFTRKHYQAIAEIIKKRIGDGFTGTDYDEGWNDAIRGIVPNLADYFKQDNSRFNRGKFLAACGID